MRFASVGSGSNGNALVIASGDTYLLVDCGFSLKELTSRLRRVDLTPSDLTAVLVTHEHADHIRGVGPLARRFGLPVYMTEGTGSSRALGRVENHCVISAGETFDIGDITVQAYRVPHDAREPVQFAFESRDGKRLGLLTDTGSIPDQLAACYHGVQALVLEANHDPEMLARGPYPASLKQRVGGFWGHLSNQQCAGLVEQLDLTMLQHLVIAHISQKNNTPQLVLNALAHVQGVERCITLACQERGFDWLQIA
ncbi:MAG TPA: MBL fold metallo-hydrolase [Marinagarivorans sp.]